MRAGSQEVDVTISTTNEELTLHPEMAGALMTPEEFDAAEIDPDDECRYELVHGVLVVTPIPSEAEVDPNELLGSLLRAYQQHHPQGRSLDKTLPERYVRTAVGRRKPDRVIWAGLGRLPDPKSDVPSIVVEFVSIGRRNWQRDYVDKRQEYEAAGVREYWVIDRFRRILTAYGRHLLPSGERIVTERELYSTVLLPGFELPLAQLLAAADDWRQ
jgi:Uma2 family endonuclease